jgi:hypothetical protein
MAKSTIKVRPEREDAINAVQSLYQDELRPVGRILRKRVAEYVVVRLGLVSDDEDAGRGVEVDGDELKTVCESCEALRVTAEKGGDWCAFRIGWAPRFVDIYSRYDSYAPEMWTAFSAYCESANVEDLTLPGGRYVCAKALMSRGLPFFNGFSLGRICHIVQLALTEKKILGYFAQSVVPYGCSQSMRKEAAAKTQQPCSAATPMPLATMESARAVLRQILDAAPHGEVPLSNVKRLFRSQFHMELSETSFGYSKVSDFLQDARFQDQLTLHLRGRGYVVTKPSLTSAHSVDRPIQQKGTLGSARVSAGPTKSGFQALAEKNGKVICLADQLHFHARGFACVTTPSPTLIPSNSIMLDRSQAHSWWPPASSMVAHGEPSCNKHNAVGIAPALPTLLLGAPQHAALLKRRPHFNPGGDLKILDKSEPSSPSGQACTYMAQPKSPSTPSMTSWRVRARDCVVKKTFLEVPETPDNPCPGTRRRASSEPPLNNDIAADGDVHLFSMRSPQSGRAPKRLDSRRSSNLSTTDDSTTTCGEDVLSTTPSTSSQAANSKSIAEMAIEVESLRMKFGHSSDLPGTVNIPECHAVKLSEISRPCSTTVSLNGLLEECGSKLRQQVLETRELAHPKVVHTPCKERQGLSVTAENTLLLTPSRMTPGKLRTRGVMVQNTFLHVAALPPSPVSSSRRSRSLPPSVIESNA